MFSRILPATLLILTSTLWAQPPAGTVIPGRFICLVDDVQDAFTIGQAAVRATGGALGHVYTNALNGFSIEVPPGIVMANLRARPGIIHVEPDIVMSTCHTVPTGVNRINAEGVLGAEIDCSGFGIAIIDTGIDIDHPDLNVMWGVRYYNGGLSDDLYDDDNGHGTHVAGIAAANGKTIVGVAPGATLYAVKVLSASGSGYMSDIIKGVDWVTANAFDFDDEGNEGKQVIHVANMSLGGKGYSPALYTAMKSCSSVVFAVAAGNDKMDVYGRDGKYLTYDDFIPAAYGGEFAHVYTISALADSDGQPGGFGPATSYGKDDSFASFSNYSRAGAIAYILPGVSILSTYPGGGLETMSGTSMASPHFAGIRALQLAKGNVTSYAQNSDFGLIQPSGDPDGKYEPLAYAMYSLDAPVTTKKMDVSDLTGSAKKVNAKTWKATVTVTVKDETGAFVSGATVKGTWNSGSTVTATTGTSGTCSFSSNFSTTVASVTFEVTDIVKSGYTYDATLDSAPDSPDSITISKPKP
jgi:subtilisin family serine protease